MENAEVEIALEELESRLERLRALYEQYFMGIERIEPQVPRKDVDRRIYLLRREKIRNTAKRFKLQTIISRYNTFQQYWQRICREIENGTYKRHVIRAERIAPGQMLTVAARKRLGKAALEAIDEEAPAKAARLSAAPPSAAPPSAAPPAVEPRPPSAPPLPSLVPRPGVPSMLGKAPPKPGLRPPPKPGTPAVAAPMPAAAPAPGPAAPRAAAPSAFDLDLDFLGDWDPGAAPSKPKRAPEGPAQPFGRALTERLGAAPAGTGPTAHQTTAARPLSAFAPSPKAIVPPGAEQPLVAPPFVSQRLPPTPAARAPLASAARAPVAAQAAPAPARVPAPTAAPLAPEAAPASLPQAPSAVGTAAPPAPPRATSPEKAPIAPSPKPFAAPPVKPLPAPLGAKALAAPIPDPSPLAPAVARPPTPVAIKPPAPPAAARPVAPRAAPPAAPAVAAPPDARVRELHARLLEAKRQTQDTSAVSVEGLARSMKATEAKLLEQHKNRKIDFDVVIKDGKAVLKPIVR